MCAVCTHTVSTFQTTSTKSPIPTSVHGCCSPKLIPAAAFTNWSPSSTAGIPISTPISTATNPWHKYTTTPMPKAKATSKPTTSTATKSASHARLPIRTAIWFGDYYGWGKLKSETNVTGVVALSESNTCTGKCQEEKNVRNV